MMHNTLHLTKPEKQAFEALPGNLKEGWKVADEVLTYEDTEHRLSIRLELMNLRDPQLKKFQQEAQKGPKEAEIRAMLKEISFKELNEDDLGEIFFALGPTLVGIIILEMLGTAKSDEEINGVAGMSAMRHELLESLR